MYVCMYVLTGANCCTNHAHHGDSIWKKSVNTQKYIHEHEQLRWLQVRPPGHALSESRLTMLCGQNSRSRLSFDWSHKVRNTITISAMLNILYTPTERKRMTKTSRSIDYAMMHKLRFRVWQTPRYFDIAAALASCLFLLGCRKGMQRLRETRILIMLKPKKGTGPC